MKENRTGDAPGTDGTCEALEEALVDAAAILQPLLGDRLARNVALAKYTTYRVGGPASLFLTAKDEQDLTFVKQAVSQTRIPVLILGKGSNVVVADAGFTGLAIVLGPRFAAIDIGPGTSGMEHDAGSGALVVRAGAAVSLPVLARQTAAASLTGLEWAVGVPGSVGGAVRMNAGGHGSQLVETLIAYQFIDLLGGTDGLCPASDLGLGYRRSNLQAHEVVTSASFGLLPGDREASELTIADIVRWRREHQPGGRNAGSVFANPAGDWAGRLIDQAGLSGLRFGSAFVSPKHTNFIQSEEGGSAGDIVRLMGEIRRRVNESTGVILELEVRLIGFDGDLLDVLPMRSPETVGPAESP